MLDEPIDDCLLGPDCIEVMGPLEIEADLGMPGGHIFHRDLQWPFAESPDDVGRWGVETAPRQRLHRAAPAPAAAAASRPSPAATRRWPPSDASDS